MGLFKTADLREECEKNARILKSFVGRYYQPLFSFSPSNKQQTRTKFPQTSSATPKALQSLPVSEQECTLPAQEAQAL
jgi:hypothetical protein